MIDYTANIRSVLARASVDDILAGTDWYRTARATCETFAVDYNVTVDTAARVIAVLSPRKRWAENVKGASIILAAFHAGEEMPTVAGFFGANIRKAWAIVNGDPSALRGQKVTRFYANIMGDDTEVTVDVWAARAASDGAIISPTVVQYREIADAYRAVAREHEMPASVLQAIVWTVVRGSAS